MHWKLQHRVQGLFRGQDQQPRKFELLSWGRNARTGPELLTRFLDSCKKVLGSKRAIETTRWGQSMQTLFSHNAGCNFRSAKFLLVLQSSTWFKWWYMILCSHRSTLYVRQSTVCKCVRIWERKRQSDDRAGIKDIHLEPTSSEEHSWLSLHSSEDCILVAPYPPTLPYPLSCLPFSYSLLFLLFLFQPPQPS